MMRGIIVPALLVAGLLAGCGNQESSITAPSEIGRAKGPTQVFDPPTERIRVYRDRETFEQAVGFAIEIDFESLPVLGSSCAGFPFDPISNPLQLTEVVFSHPACLETFLCPQALCVQQNVTLHMKPGGLMKFPPGTGGALFRLDGMGDMPFALIVKDGNGRKHGLFGIAKGAETTWLGFTITSGIRSVRVRSTLNDRALIMSSVFYQGAGELRADRLSVGVR